MQRDDVIELLAYAKALWQRQFVAPSNEDELSITTQVWMEMIGDLDVELVHSAMSGWKGEWPPNPGQLRESALELHRNAQGINPDPSEDEAWREFKANYKLDYDGYHEWSHPAIANAARALGCRAFGQSEESNEFVWRAHFNRYFASALERHRRETRPVAPVVQRYLEREKAKRELDEAGPAELAP